MQITDVSLRDGLQMEALPIELGTRVKLFRALVRCGFSRIEITSFVHPKWIPQFADADEFCQELFQEEVSVPTMAFVPNEKGLERLLAHPIDWACAFVSTSETFNQKNVNCSVADSLKNAEAVVKRAQQEGRKARIYVSTVFGCPYEKDAVVQKSPEVLKAVMGLGADEIAPSDTIGVATPALVESLVGPLVQSDASRIALHFHNTYGNAGTCIETAYRMGVRKFDGSLGGVGGCPYAKGASGNVASDDLHYLAWRQGWVDEFTGPAYRAALELYAATGLNLRSHLNEIRASGGDWYGV